MSHSGESRSKSQKSKSTPSAHRTINNNKSSSKPSTSCSDRRPAVSDPKPKKVIVRQASPKSEQAKLAGVLYDPKIGEGERRRKTAKELEPDFAEDILREMRASKERRNVGSKYPSSSDEEEGGSA
ncbi:hypothetical protein LTS08_007469 [Lithohypha guttulata]|nr:hypothetical protein LTS08_007469 [Lithohypha guttulata]